MTIRPDDESKYEFNRNMFFLGFLWRCLRVGLSEYLSECLSDCRQADRQAGRQVGR